MISELNYRFKLIKSKKIFITLSEKTLYMKELLYVRLIKIVVMIRNNSSFFKKFLFK